MQTTKAPNINYTKLPREKVYCDRRSLDDFDINNHKSVEKWMMACIYNSEIMELDDAETYVVDIFNTAHYITTVILAQQYPMMSIAWSIKTAKRIGVNLEHENESACKLFVAITLAMVINYLKICDKRYCREGDMFVGNIERWVKNNYDFHSEGLRLFKNAMTYIPKEVITNSREFMSREDFKPLSFTEPESHLHVKMRESNIDKSEEDELNALKKECEEWKKKYEEAITKEPEKAFNAQTGNPCFTNRQMGILLTAVGRITEKDNPPGKTTLGEIVENISGYKATTAGTNMKGAIPIDDTEAVATAIESRFPNLAKEVRKLAL